MSAYRALCVFLAAVGIAGTAVASPRVKMSLNDAWRFLPEDRNDAEHPNQDDSNWQRVDLPHTWNAFDPFDDAPGYRRGGSWYRRQLTIEPRLRDKRLFLFFEGVHQKADVFINNRLIGQHKGGYSAFCFDVTKYLNLKGENLANLLAVRADNSWQDDIPPLDIGFGHYGGIYRDVWLLATDAVHFDLTNHASPGVFVSTQSVSSERGVVRVRGTVVNDTAAERKVAVKLALTNPNDKPSAQAVVELTLPASGKAEFDQLIDVTTPLLWSPDTPHLYSLRCTILDGDKPLDEYTTPAGFRWFKFDANEGFSLNGQKMMLRGASRHQDFDRLGSALPNATHRSDLQWLKDMGANFIRVAHYPQDPEILATADRIGLIAWEEIPVVSTISASPAFTETCKSMIVDMIRQHYNHPSIVMWGTMNETLLNWGRMPNRDEAFLGHVKNLVDELDALVRKEDPTRVTTLAMNQGDSYDKAGIGSVPHVAGWNLYTGWYHGKFEDFGKYLDANHQKYPNRVLFVSEYGAGSDARLHSLKPQRFDHSIEWMNLYHEAHLRQINARPWLNGVAIWNQFDFSQPGVGDSIPHMNQKGMLTFDRKPKDVYYLYQANWSKKPMLHIATKEWLQRSGVVGTEHPVKIYSNANEVELLLNGKSVGAKKPDDVNSAEWRVVFQPGDNWLEARAGDLRDAAKVNFRAYPAKLSDPAILFEEIAVNAGGNVSYFDPRQPNVIWEPDQPYTPGSWGYLGDGSEDHWKAVSGVLRADILGTDEDPLYQAFRRGVEGYRFDVPDGDYELELRFTEYWPNSPGQRVFRVLCNGQVLIDKLDLAESPGPRRALARTFANLRAADGKGLHVTFEAIVAKSVVSGLRVRRIR